MPKRHANLSANNLVSRMEQLRLVNVGGTPRAVRFSPIRANDLPHPSHGPVRVLRRNVVSTPSATVLREGLVIYMSELSRKNYDAFLSCVVFAFELLTMRQQALTSALTSTQIGKISDYVKYMKESNGRDTLSPFLKNERAMLANVKLKRMNASEFADSHKKLINEYNKSRGTRGGSYTLPEPPKAQVVRQLLSTTSGERYVRSQIMYWIDALFKEDIDEYQTFLATVWQNMMTRYARTPENL